MIIATRNDKSFAKTSGGYCANCMAPIKRALDADSRRFFSEDLFCQCGEASCMTVFPYHMKELDEVRGDLQHIESVQDGCLAVIGEISVLLPSELETKLQDLVGQRVGIIRLEGYRVRALG
jgi:hypothetical protein